MRTLEVVSCTRGGKEQTDLFRSLSRLGIENQVFIENNIEGLATCYNRYLEANVGRDIIAVFAHDDVLIEDVFLAEKLEEGANRFAVQGLAGAASFDPQLSWPQTVWIRAPREHLSGAVSHSVAPDTTMWSAYGPVPRPCVVLDGLFLAVDLAKVGAVRFDERFQFHFYDLDFCLSAHRAGLPIGTVNVHARHQSGGDFSSRSFFDAQGIFRSKWTEAVPLNSHESNVTSAGVAAPAQRAHGSRGPSSGPVPDQAR